MSAAFETASLKATRTQSRQLWPETAPLEDGNHFRFVVLPFEDTAAYERLLANLDHEFEPVTPTELLLVEQVAQHTWLHDRAHRFHNALFPDGIKGPLDEKKVLFFARLMGYYLRAQSRSLAALRNLRTMEHASDETNGAGASGSIYTHLSERS